MDTRVGGDGSGFPGGSISIMIILEKLAGSLHGNEDVDRPGYSISGCKNGERVLSGVSLLRI